MFRRCKQFAQMGAMAQCPCLLNTPVLPSIVLSRIEPRTAIRRSRIIWILKDFFDILALNKKRRLSCCSWSFCLWSLIHCGLTNCAKLKEGSKTPLSNFSQRLEIDIKCVSDGCYGIKECIGCYSKWSHWHGLTTFSKLLAEDERQYVETSNGLITAALFYSWNLVNSNCGFIFLRNDRHFEKNTLCSVKNSSI